MQIKCRSAKNANALGTREVYKCEQGPPSSSYCPSVQFDAVTSREYYLTVTCLMGHIIPFQYQSNSHRWMLKFRKLQKLQKRVENLDRRMNPLPQEMKFFLSTFVYRS